MILQPHPAPESATQDWWRGAVIYQIYPRSFSDSDGDGIGDLRGATARLDHIASLGVDAIWLSPFFTSPQQDFGYDVSDHLAVDPMFGDMADFDALVARAHELGLKVLIDQVWSHTSDQHRWFRESRASRDNPRADWYVWANPLADGTPPNNWLSVFGGSAWKWEPRRRQYYLHHFLSSQPALNFHNPRVVDAMLDIGRFWLDRGVDGFRFDAIDWLMHDRRLRNNPPAPYPEHAAPAKPFAMQFHRHDLLQPEIMGVLARIRGLLDQYPGTAALGEVSSQPGAAWRVLDVTAGDERLHTAYSLAPLRGGFGWNAVCDMVADNSSQGKPGWPCLSFSNHDTERAISRWNPGHGAAPPDPRFARLLLSLLLSMRGSVCIYQGEELGLTEAELEYEQLRDPFGIAYWPEFRGRDGSRTPMPWHQDRPNAGFSTAEPWLPIPQEHLSLAVDAQEADASSLLHVWRDMLRFRRAHSSLVTGTLTPLATQEPCVGFVRENADERMLCLFNLSSQTVRIAPGPLGLDRLGGEHQLGPYEASFRKLPPSGAREGDLQTLLGVTPPPSSNRNVDASGD
jgi:alpha-glucosidase